MGQNLRNAYAKHCLNLTSTKVCILADSGFLYFLVLSWAQQSHLPTLVCLRSRAGNAGQEDYHDYPLPRVSLAADCLQALNAAWGPGQDSPSPAVCCKIHTLSLPELLQQELGLPLDPGLVALFSHPIVSEYAQGKPPDILPGGSIIENNSYGRGSSKGYFKCPVLGEMGLD